MSLEPMEFEKANDGHLVTWKRVCKAFTYTSVFLVVVLGLLAFALL